MGLLFLLEGSRFPAKKKKKFSRRIKKPVALVLFASTFVVVSERVSEAPADMKCERALLGSARSNHGTWFFSTSLEADVG